MSPFDVSPSLHAALDRPIWLSLNGGHRHLALGGPLAQRYPRDMSPFAALASEELPAWRALAELLVPDEAAMMITPCAAEAPLGAGLVSTALEPVLQMVATREPPPSALPFELLGEADAEAMRQLAGLTNPGPFAARTYQMGEFFGIRDGGMLAAMTGERMRPDGAVEVTAVCVHPAHRGKAYARHLLADRTRRIAASGRLPFLHTYASNHAAIALYESLGYVVRNQLHLTRVMLAD